MFSGYGLGPKKCGSRFTSVRTQNRFKKEYITGERKSDNKLQYFYFCGLKNEKQQN